MAHSDRPTLEVAITGQGVTPEEVPVRELVNLLEATAQLLEAVSDEAAPHVALVQIKHGSAQYDFRAAVTEHDAAFGHVAQLAYQAIEQRGKDWSPRVRGAITRLQRAGTARGGVRFAYRGMPTAKPALQVSAPIELVASHLTTSTVMYGTIVGVEAKRDRCLVLFKPVDTPKIEIETDDHWAAIAGRMFNRRARVAIQYDWVNVTDERKNWTLLELTPWNEQPFSEAIAAVRKELAERNSTFDANALLRDILEGDA